MDERSGGSVAREFTIDVPASKLAEGEMFADVVRDALLTRYPGAVRPVHRVVLARLLREGAAALLAGIDAVREVAGRGESREAALEAFVWASMRGEPCGASHADDPAALEALQREHVQRVGEDAYLLERMAADRQAFADDASGIDPVEAVQAAADAEGLRALALRHAVHYARRDVLLRPPFARSDLP
ncbi:MAG TPA: hypothetical protein VFR37_04985 [Longimicrobium sp.]|nr:hypothetical protein [Longimicrobium sp.]